MHARAVVLLAFGACYVACGEGESGESDACAETYGFVVDGEACNPDGDPSMECPEVTCSCSGSTTQSAFACVEGTCLTAIGNCEAWCAATSDERFACL